MGRVHSTLAAMIVLLSLPGAASAEDQRTDPKADSPAGTIYEIPLDTGRRDAAPLRPSGKDGQSGGTGAGSGGTAGSSQTRKSAGAQGGATGSTADDSAEEEPETTTKRPGGASADDPSSIHSENGFGSSSTVPDRQAASLGSGTGSGSSSVPAVALIVLIAGLAAWVGRAVAGSLRGP